MTNSDDDFLLRLSQFLSVVVGGLVVVAVSTATYCCAPGAISWVREVYEPPKHNPAAMSHLQSQIKPLEFSNGCLFEGVKFDPQRDIGAIMAENAHRQVMHDINRANSMSRPPYHP